MARDRHAARVVAALLQLAAASIGAVALAEHASAQDIRGVWRLRYADDQAAPAQRTVQGVDSELHGTYESSPYLSVITRPDGSLRLVSDEIFGATLAPIAGRAGAYTVVPDGATASVATLVVNDARCGARPRCFSFQDVKDTPGLHAGTDDVYVPMKPKVAPDDPDKRLQVYGDMFTPIPSSFGLVRRCYNLLQMSVDDFQVTGCQQFLFAEPDKLSLAYDKIPFSGLHENEAVPWGWSYISNSRSTAHSRTHIFESGRELSDVQQRTIGYNVGANLGPVDLSASYSATTKDRIDNMYSKGLTYSQFDFLKTEYVLVVDKTNLNLSQVFRGAVRDLQLLRNFDDFINNFGTHYAYATTFGAYGRRFTQMSQDDVMKLHENGTDVAIGASVGLNGGEGGVSAGVTNETAKQHMANMKRILGEQVEESVCVGGSDCNSGQPSAGDRVPVLLDLRPISDLLGPPFYDDDAVATELRQALAAAIVNRVFYRRDDAGQASARFAGITEPTVNACGNTRFGDRQPLDNWPRLERGGDPQTPTFSNVLWQCCPAGGKITGLMLHGNGDKRFVLAGGKLPTGVSLVGFMPDDNTAFIDNVAMLGSAPDYATNWPGGDAFAASFYLFGSCLRGCPTLPPPFPALRELAALPKPIYRDADFQPLSGFGLTPVRAIVGLQFKDADCKAVNVEMSMQMEPLTARSLIAPSTLPPTGSTSVRR